MTPKVFHERFNELIESALSENPVPLSQMICDLHCAAFKRHAIDAALKQQHQQFEAANRIIPANGIPSLRKD